MGRDSLAREKPVAQVRALIDEVRSQRERRSAILSEARRSRKRARDLRRDAVFVRDRTLDHRWGLWSGGLVPEPPSYVPETWRLGGDRDLDTLFEEAGLTCLECRDAALEVKEAHVLAALSDVTAERLAERRDGCDFLLSATARFIDRLDPRLRRDDPEVIVCLSAMRRCRDACLAALVALG